MNNEMIAKTNEEIISEESEEELTESSDVTDTEDISDVMQEPPFANSKRVFLI